MMIRRRFPDIEKHGLHVTFFMTGGWVEKYPEDKGNPGSRAHDSKPYENHKNMAQLSVENRRQKS